MTKAVKPILGMFATEFGLTRVGQTSRVNDDFGEALCSYAASLGMTLCSNGFSHKMATKTARTAWRARAEKWGVPTGMFEWGPAGRGDPPQKLINIYRNAIGYDAVASLAPWAKHRYLPLGLRLEGVETPAEYEAALKLAHEKLRQ